MRYISLFSGIEAASVAWEPLGFEPVAFSEVDPFCCQLLAKRFPGVPNLGDIKTIDWGSYHGSIDLVVGGSPCQAFSVAGPRTGLLDERSALMLEYVRAVREIEPTWCIWENVPGVLSQERGRAFATLQRELADCGLSLAWRVLDAQFTRIPMWDSNGSLAGWLGPVAQRRRRVFLVGHTDPRCAAAVLFERESLLGDHPSSADARKALAGATQKRARKAGSRVGSILDLYENHGKDARVKGPMDTCPTITALYGTGGNNTPLIHHRSPLFPSYALVGNIIGRKPENGGNGAGFSEELCYTLTAMDNHAVCENGSVRRLMPIECERLQGFPDGWTMIEWNGKPADQCPDSRRYKALGNSMAVPVMTWLGRRIQMVDELYKAGGWPVLKAS